MTAVGSGGVSTVGSMSLRSERKSERKSEGAGRE